ncbi:MAG: sugar transferase [Microscillaceae bacterium]
MPSLLQKCLALLALLLLLLPGLLVMLSLWPSGPVFFTQVRVGFREKPFRLYKFRTMRRALDARGQPLPDAQRLTRWGNFLRRYSIDEWPQLWHVLWGEMHLVGPRPLPPEYLPYYTSAQRQRHQVKPGLTGLAQIRGRNRLPWAQRLRLDAWYAAHRSPGLDLYILCQTARRLLRHPDGDVLSEKFLPPPPNKH